MESQLYTQWVQTQISEASQQQQHAVIPQHEAARTDDWSKERSQSLQSLAADLNEFAALGDLPGSSNTSSIPAPTYFSYLNPSYLQLPFNTIPYGSPWPSTPAPIPVSTYSSLNGATTATTSTSQQQTQQQQPTQTSAQQQPIQTSQSSQMAIDPLLTLNGNIQTAFTQSSSNPNNQQFPSQQSQSTVPQRTYPFNQPLLYAPSAYYRPQNPQSPQGTLSPQALHSPSLSMMQTTFYAHPQSQSLQTQPQQVQPTPSASPAINPIQGEALSSVNPNSASRSAQVSGLTPEEKEERKRKFLISVRPLLQSSAFSGAQAVQHLTERIADFGISDVDAQTRLDILARIRDGAGNHYYRAWSENNVAVEITREWIKAAAKDDSGGLQETIMPLLHLIDRLPFYLESLAASKLGKVIKNLGKGERSAAIKDMASNLERRWRDMLTMEEDNSKEDTKKRKGVDPTTTNKGAAPVKKAAVGNASSTKPVVFKKETKSTAPPVKDAKADSSFFSAPKSKAKLPSFKKAPAGGPVKKEEIPVNLSNNVSQPSNFDPFQEALKAMKVGKRDSPAVSTPPPNSADSTDTQTSSATFKKKKSVSWAPDGKLESIKLIERAVYDDDPTDVKYGMHSFRDMDREEGAAMHARLFEEALDWYDPIFTEMPPDPDPNNPRLPRGHASEEKGVQEKREQSALSAVYMTTAQIPESPAELATVLSEEETDKDVKMMHLGDELETLFYPAAPAVDPSMSMSIDPNLNVSQLIGQLSSAVSSAMDTTPQQAPSAYLNSVAAVQNLRPEQVQQLLAQISSTMGVGSQQPFGQFGTATPDGGSSDTSVWGSGATPHHFPDYGYPDESDQSRWEDQSGRGARGRGGGREWGGKPYSSRKTRPCLFFQQQRCKYGDQCDFLHELVSPGER